MYLDTPVLTTSFDCIICGYRTFGTEALVAQTGCIDAAVDEVVVDGLCPVDRESLVVLLGSDDIGVALNLGGNRVRREPPA